MIKIAMPKFIYIQIAIVKQLEIKGKTVTVPQALKQELGVTDEPAPDDKAKKKAERAARRKVREEAKSNNQKNSDQQSRESSFQSVSSEPIQELCE